MNDGSSPKTKNLICFLWVTTRVPDLDAQYMALLHPDQDLKHWQFGSDPDSITLKLIIKFTKISTYSTLQGTVPCLSRYLLCQYVLGSVKFQPTVVRH